MAEEIKPSFDPSEFVNGLNKIAAELAKITAKQEQAAAATAKHTAQMDKQSAAAKAMSKEIKATSDAIQRGFTGKDLAAKGPAFEEVFNFKNQLGKMKELQAQFGITAEKAKKMMSDIVAGNAVAYTGNERLFQAQLVKTLQARDKIGESARTSMAAQVAADEKAAAASKVAADAQVSSANRIAKARALVTSIEEGRPRGIKATAGEAAAYANAVSRAQEIAAKSQIPGSRIQEIFASVKSGSPEIVSGAEERRLQAAIVKVLDVQQRLGTEYQKQLATEAKLVAETEKEAIAKQKVAIAAQQATATRRMVTRGVSIGEAGASEVAAYVRDLENLRKVRESVGTRMKQADVKSIWQNIQAGNIQTLEGDAARVQAALLKVSNTQALLGRNMRAQIEGETAAYFRNAIINVDKLDGSLKRTKETTDSFVKSWGFMGRILAVQLAHQAISKLTSAIGEGVDKALELGKRIAEVRTISQDRQLTTPRWTQGFRELADQFGTPVLKQVEAGYQAISDQVVKGADTFKYLADVNQFALASVMDVDKAQNLLSASINSFGLDLSRTGEIAQNFFKTIELGRVRGEEMAESYGRLAVPAHALGLTYQELNAMISATTRQGLKFSEAGTYIRNLLISLIKPSDDLKEYYREIGVESGQAAVATYGWSNLLSMLSVRFKDNTGEIGSLIKNLRSMMGAFLLTGKNLEKYVDDLAQSELGLKRWEETVALVTDTVPKRFQVAMEQIKNYFIVDVGAGFLEKFNEFLNSDFSKIVDGVKAVASLIKFSLTPAIILASGAFLNFLAASPWGALLTALGGAVTLISYIGERWKRVALEIDEATKKNQENWLKRENENINAAFDGRVRSVQEAGRIELETIARQRSLVNQSLDPYKETYKGFLRNIGDFGSKVTDSVRDKLQEVRSEITRLNNITKKHKSDLQSEFELIDKINERRLAGKDIVGGNKMSDLQKRGFIASEIEIAERELRKAAQRADEVDFGKWEGQLKKAVNKMVDFNDELLATQGEKGRFLHGENYLTSYYNDIERYRRAMQSAATAEAVVQKNRERGLEDQMSQIDDLVALGQFFKSKDFFKLTDPKELDAIMAAQKKAVEGLKAYATKYGTDFYKKDELADQQAALEEMAYQKRVEFALKAEAEITEAAIKGQIARINEQRKLNLENERAMREGLINAQSIVSQVETGILTMNKYAADVGPSLTAGIQAANPAQAIVDSFKGTDFTSIGNQIGVDIAAGIRSQMGELNIGKGTFREEPKWPVGNFASGRSGGIDTMRAMISPDEFVMNPKASRTFYSTLASWNAGVRRFSSGYSPSYQVGDIHVHGATNSDGSVDVAKIGRKLKREIRRGRLVFA